MKDKKFYYSKSDYISYTQIGNGETNIVFIHGFGANKHSRDDIKHKFDTKKYKLFLIDLKGFGDSSMPEDEQYSIKDNCAIIKSFIEDTIKGEFILIGHSYGGGSCLYLTSQMGMKPKKMVLVDPACYNLITVLFLKLLDNSKFNDILFSLSRREIFANAFLKLNVYKDNFKEGLLKRYEKSFSGDIQYTIQKTAQVIVPENYDEIIESYDNIDTQTLILWGEQDMILPVSHGKKLNKQLQNSELEIIDKCGHIPHEELPDLTFGIISNFLKK